MNDLNKIFDTTRELANMLLETDEGKALNDARYIYDGDAEAQRKLEEYSAYRQRVQLKMNNGEMSEEELDAENEVMNAKIKELRENKVIQDLFTAEHNFNHIVGHVMNVFNATLAGEEALAGGCSGSCSSCGGCH